MGNNTESVSASEAESKPGPFLAKVISHLDSSYMGGLEVEILRSVGNDGSSGQTHQVKYMSPFFGVTSADFLGADADNNDYNNTQKSYGMWMVPPDPGSTVIIVFIDGDPKRGYWMGCVQDNNMNFMVPGLAATQHNLADSTVRLPVAEYNKTINKTNTTSDPTKIVKPKHPFADILIKSGLDKDDIRGITSSSARRETPSMVFGISTPGPLDKKSGAKQGTIGKKDHPINNAYVSRLGGSTFVMDDGDDKFLRKQPASVAGPEYVSPEQGDTSGDVTIPHNELVRIRTRTGHQILLHNSEDLIYISHGSGKSWIEMTANGKIDVYAADSISFYTGKDFNFTAERDINFTANRNVNTNAAGYIRETSVGPNETKTSDSIKETSGGTNETKAGGKIIESGSQIQMNGPAASAAKPALKANRIPRSEPWMGHENLNPTAEYEATESPVEPTGTPAYTTGTDTFAKVKGPDDAPQEGQQQT
jgi:hypothetical protein